VSLLQQNRTDSFRRPGAYATLLGILEPFTTVPSNEFVVQQNQIKDTTVKHNSSQIYTFYVIQISD
jgi:hypothetical protein